MFINNSSPRRGNLSYMVVAYIGIVLNLIAIYILYIKIKAINEVLAEYIAKYNYIIKSVNTEVKNINNKLDSIDKTNINLRNITYKIYARVNTIDSTINDTIVKNINTDKAKNSSNNDKLNNTLSIRKKTFRKLKTAKK